MVAYDFFSIISLVLCYHCFKRLLLSRVSVVIQNPSLYDRKSGVLYEHHMFLDLREIFVLSW